MIHNSTWLADIGYYYPDFDCQQAGRQLLRAHHHHDEQLQTQAQKVRTLFASLDPLAPANVQAYSVLLQELMGAAS